MTSDNPFTLKRYTAMPFEDNLGNEWPANMEETAEGEWVKYADILKLVALIRRTREMVEEAKEKQDEA